MTVLVTGVSGFVGGRITEMLVRRGRAVRGAVRNDRTPVPDSVEAVAVGDIGPDTEWNGALGGVDTVIHAAAHVHRPGEAADVAERHHRTVNAKGTRRLAEAASAAGVQRFVLISTVKVLGEASGDRPFDDASDPRPADAYARSKLDAENFLFEVCERGRMEAVALRPPLVYGPGVKANFLSLIRLCSRPLPLPFGLLDNRRSLLFVDNLADAAIAAATSPEVCGRRYVVDDGEPVSTSNLVRGLRRAMGQPAMLLPVPLLLLRWGMNAAGRRGLFERLAGNLAVDASRFRRHAGWEPPVSFEDGIDTTVRWFRAGEAH